MRAARYFGATAHTCTYCKNRRFHTQQEHTREFTRHLEEMRPARRRRVPGASEFNAQCVFCLRSRPHTDSEHDRQVQAYLESDGYPERDEPDDFRDHYGI
jgi:hypothetical protein